MMYANPLRQEPRVLLCDDSDAERKLLAQILISAGYAVEQAPEGMSAIVYLKHRAIDVVVLDLQMPEVDGFQVLAYIQEHRRALPVVLLSGMPLHKIQPRIHLLPTQELPPLLIKPVDPDQLLGILELQLAGGLSEATPSSDEKSA